MRDLEVSVERVEAVAYTIPTDALESDGTKEWDSTTFVVVHVHAGGEVGLGYTYGPSSVAHLVVSMLADSVCGESALEPHRIHAKLRASLRDAGQAGLGALALSAVDIALHDLRARLLDLPLTIALDAVHDWVPVYGSGGFTSYDGARVARAADPLGRAGDSAGEDEGRTPPGAGPEACRRRAGGDRSERRADGRCQRCVQSGRSIGVDRPPRAVRHQLLRGTGLE